MFFKYLYLLLEVVMKNLLINMWTTIHSMKV